MAVFGLPIDRLVPVDVNLTPLGAPLNNFRVLLVLGTSPGLHTDIENFSGIDEVGSIFATTTPEYQASALYFEQVPRPNTIAIGRWAQSPTAGVMIGGILSTAQQQMSNFTGVTNGGFHISTDGVTAVNVTGINLSGAINLNGVAALIDTAYTGGTVVWDPVNHQFVFQSSTTGATSSVGFTTAPTTGTDLGPLLLTTAALATQSTPGHIAESALAAVQRLDGYDWYGLTVASTSIVDADQVLIANYIEGSTNRHIFGVSTMEAGCTDITITSDIGSQLQSLGLSKTFVHYSSSNPYSAASFFGRAFSVDFAAFNSTITMMFKQMPGIAGETLSTQQADALEGKHINVFVNYRNNTSIIQYGTMAGPFYFDEIYGIDGLADSIQDSLFNVLYQNPKIPQTDAGVHILVTGCEHSLSQFSQNGLIAPGVWNAQGFGTLNNGDYLPKGWYTFADSVDNQLQPTREQRIAPAIQIAVKLAGAVHEIPVLINVNR